MEKLWGKLPKMAAIMFSSNNQRYINSNDYLGSVHHLLSVKLPNGKRTSSIVGQLPSPPYTAWDGSYHWEHGKENQ